MMMKILKWRRKDKALRRYISIWGYVEHPFVGSRSDKTNKDERYIPPTFSHHPPACSMAMLMQ